MAVDAQQYAVKESHSFFSSDKVDINKMWHLNGASFFYPCRYLTLKQQTLIDFFLVSVKVDIVFE